ncbi:unnamed protein product, partial [Rotaria sp. Silwood2]
SLVDHHNYFISEKDPTNDKMVLDIDLFRADKNYDPQVVRDSQKKRYKQVELVDQVIAYDKLWRTVRYEADAWNKIKNLSSRTVTEKKQAKENDGDSEEFNKDFTISLEIINAEFLAKLTIKQIIRLSTLIDTEIEKIKEKLIKIENERNMALYEIGNLVHESVPISDNEVKYTFCHISTCLFTIFIVGFQ